jgi:hypothetical protein
VSLYLVVLSFANFVVAEFRGSVAIIVPGLPKVCPGSGRNQELK